MFFRASHHKPGKGNNHAYEIAVMSAQVLQPFDTSYRPEENLNKQSSKQYQHNICTKWMIPYFMNTETYDQYEIPVANVQEELKFILKTQT